MSCDPRCYPVRKECRVELCRKGLPSFFEEEKASGTVCVLCLPHQPTLSCLHVFPLLLSLGLLHKSLG